MSVIEQIKKRQSFKGQTAKITMKSGVTFEFERAGFGAISKAIRDESLTGVARVLLKSHLKGWEFPGVEYTPDNVTAVTEEMSTAELDELGAKYWATLCVTDREEEKKLQESILSLYSGSPKDSEENSNQTSSAQPASS